MKENKLAIQRMEEHIDKTNMRSKVFPVVKKMPQLKIINGRDVVIVTNVNGKGKK